jgi:hypothetical protein
VKCLSAQINFSLLKDDENLINDFDQNQKIKSDKNKTNQN